MYLILEDKELRQGKGACYQDGYFTLFYNHLEKLSTIFLKFQNVDLSLKTRKRSIQEPYIKKDPIILTVSQKHHHPHEYLIGSWIFNT